MEENNTPTGIRMKWLLLLAFISIFFLYNKDAKPDKNSRDVEYGYSAAFPRMRVNRTASLTLSTTWQRIDFSGVTGNIFNTFGTDPVSGQPLVAWDATNKLFKFYNTMDVNYFGYFTGACSATLLTTPVSLRYRFVIPNGVSPGTPYYFPNPDPVADQYSDLGPVAYIAHRPFDQTLPLYINQMIRTNGVGIEVCLSNGTLGTVTLDYCGFLISAGAPIN